jgi:hypothetical protein
MQQHYLLGQFLRRRYVLGEKSEKFLNASYSTDEIFVRSTNYNRTVQSALANLAGFYPSNGFTEELHWSPIPIHINNTLIHGAMSINCPKYNQLTEQLHKSAPWKKREAERQPFYDFMTRMTNYATPINGTNMGQIFDALRTDIWNKRKLPPWINSSVYDKVVHYSWSYPISDPTWTKYKTGFLLDEIIVRMKDKAQVIGHRLDPNPRLKLLIYSAHDSIVEPLLRAMRVFNHVNPPYASTLFFELHQTENSEFFVKVLYRNTTTDYASADPLVLQVEGCPGVKCSLSSFALRSVPYTMTSESYAKECGLPDLDLEIWRMKALAILFGCSTLIAFFLLVYSHAKTRHREAQLRKYRQFLAMNEPLADDE